MVQRLQKNPKNPKKSTIKSRVTAALVAVFALVPALVLGIFAYPGQSYIPYNGSYDLPDMAAAEQFQHIAEHNLVGQSVGDQWEYTFLPVSLTLRTTADWSYISYQLSIADENNNEFGHYTIGTYYDQLTSSEVYRIGWDYTINGIRHVEFPYVETNNDALAIMLGYRVTKLSDGRSVVDMELVRYDPTSGEIVQTGYVSAEIPQVASKVFLQIKTNYASTKGYTIDNTVVAPHTPVDLLYIGEAYDKGKADLQESGQVVTSTIWQIISMPFDILANILNFELLGVNLWSMATVLMTVGILFFVLKKVGVF